MSLAPAPAPGSIVSAHWDWVCGTLSDAESRRAGRRRLSATSGPRQRLLRKRLRHRRIGAHWWFDGRSTMTPHAGGQMGLTGATGWVIRRCRSVRRSGRRRAGPGPQVPQRRHAVGHLTAVGTARPSRRRRVRPPGDHGQAGAAVGCTRRTGSRGAGPGGEPARRPADRGGVGGRTRCRRRDAPRAGVGRPDAVDRCGPAPAGGRGEPHPVDRLRRPDGAGHRDGSC